MTYYTTIRHEIKERGEPRNLSVIVCICELSIIFNNKEIHEEDYNKSFNCGRKIKRRRFSVYLSSSKC